jgi:hypothetical protein
MAMRNEAGYGYEGEEETNGETTEDETRDDEETGRDVIGRELKPL